MVKQPPSIFNDVIGPVMKGPSSSHTAGPTRIGKLARQLLKGNMGKALVEFAAGGRMDGIKEKAVLGPGCGLKGSAENKPCGFFVA